MCVLLLATIPGGTQEDDGEPSPVVNGFTTWTFLSTDNGDLELPTGPGSEQTATLILDIDGDGLNDFVIADRDLSPSLVWYRREVGGWSKFLIESDLLPIEAGGTYFDIDQDGDPDIVEGGDSRSDEMWWWENPAPNFDVSTPWIRRTIKVGGLKQHHDCIFGDFDADGQSEFVFWSGNSTEPTLNLAEIPADPYQDVPWPFVPFYTTTGLAEGIAVADIDGDGADDLVAGGYWFKYAGGSTFTPNVIDSSQPYSRAAVGQLIPGGWPEVVLVIGDSKPSASIDGKGPLKWYEWNGLSWDAHELLPFDTDHGHSLEVVDLNGDGHLDIFNAEMHLLGNDDAAMRVFYGDSYGNFVLDEFENGFDNHESKVGDLDGDGDLDILGKPFADSPGIHIWLNEGAPLGVLPLDRWERHSVDSSQPWLAVFALPGDLDGDGLTDIASGGWWYRNTGDYSTWERTPIGSPLHNVALLYDFDTDGDLDILGTSGLTQAPEHPGPPDLYWALNDGDGNFTVLSNVTPGVSSDPDSAFVQGIFPARFTDPNGPLQIALSWNFGEFGTSGIDLLTLPGDPINETWPLETINSFSEGEELDAADLDGDGDLDLFQGSGWLRNDGGSWTRITVTDLIGNNAPYDDADRVSLADIDGDGDLDAVIGLLFETASEPVDLVWLEHPADPEGEWPLHVVAGGIWGGFSLSVDDMDNDGDQDIVVGEHVGLTRLLIFENGGDGFTWTQHVADSGGSGIDHHDGALTVDFDQDGDLDVVSLGWHNQKVWLFENHAVEPRVGGVPGTPTDLTASAFSSAQVDLQWKRGAGSGGLLTYDIYRDGEYLDTTSFLHYSDFTTEELTTYEYSVVALSALNISSQPSPPASVVTPAYDPLPPSAPVALSAAAPTPGRVELSWEAASDNVAVVGYEVEESGQFVKAVPGLSASVSPLTPGTSYSFEVFAVDAQGNRSVPAQVDISTPPVVTGLWGAWGFEEVSGADCFDSSGNENDGLLENNAGRSQNGYFGAALDVSGNPGHVNLGPLDIFSDGLTIMAWFNGDDFATYDARIISKATGTAEQDHFWMLSTMKVGSARTLRFRLRTEPGGTDTLVADTGTLSTGTWHHVAATYDGASMRLYLDGQLVGSQSKTGPVSLDATVDAWIGANPDNDKHFNGRIDEVRIYGSALSEPDILQAMIAPIATDDTPPTVPGGVVATAESATSISVDWQLSTDDTAVAGYRVSRNGVQVGVTAQPPFIDQNLQPVTLYSYSVEAFDSSGNDSGPSSSADATTLADVDPPTQPVLSASVLSISEIELSWTPATDNIGVTEYQLFRDGAYILSTTSTSVVDSGLASGTQYSYAVSALDAAGNQTTSASILATTPIFDDEAPSAPGNLVAVATSPTSLSASWDAATDNIGVTSYSVYLAGVLAATTTETTIVLSSLAAGNTYSVAVTASDAAGNESTPAATSVSTPLPETDLVGAWGFEESSGAVATDSSGYGYDGTLGGAAARGLGHTGSGLETDGVSGHVDLGGLDPFSDQLTIMMWVKADDFGVYDARLVSKSTSASEQDHYWMLSTFSNERLRFRLKAGGSTSTLVANSGSLIAGQWHHVAATYDGSSMKLFLDGAEVGSGAKSGIIDTDPAVSAWIGSNPGSPAQVFDGVIDDVKFFADALDAAQIADEMGLPVAPPGPPDTTPPSVPGNVVASPLSETQVQLGWDASTDDVAVQAYRIRRDGVEVGTTTELIFQDSALLPDSTYAYTVEAFDAASNDSGESSAIQVTTLADTTLPSVPATLAAVAVSDTEVDLSWQPSVDNIGVSGYRVWRDGVEIATTGATGFSDAGLLADTEYTYQVEAFDAAGNLSGLSAPASATTLFFDDEPPTVPIITEATVISPTSAQLFWSPSVDNLAVAGYRVYVDDVLAATTALTDVVLVDLTPGALHNVTIGAFDATGNESDPSLASTTLDMPLPDFDWTGAWGFEEAAGESAVLDASGSGFDGTLVGNISRVPGYVGGGVQTDGVSGHVDLGALDPFADQLTIMMWVKADDFGVYDARLISKSTGSASEDHYWMISTFKKRRLRFRLKTTDGTTSTLVAPTGSLSAGQWHHVAATYDGATMRLFLDGAQVGSLAKSGSVVSEPSVPAWIGANPGEAGQVFDGTIDDVKFLPVALDSAAIAAEMAIAVP